MKIVVSNGRVHIFRFRGRMIVNKSFFSRNISQEHDPENSEISIIRFDSQTDTISTTSTFEKKLEIGIINAGAHFSISKLKNP